MNEHTCQQCGLHQQVESYDEDPEFVALEIDSSYLSIDEVYAVTVEIGIDRNRRFECEACGHTVDFNADIVDPGLAYSMSWNKDVPYEMVTRQAIARVEAEHDTSEYL